MLVIFKLFIVRKFPKTNLQFNIVIVQSTEAVNRGALLKKLFLKISQYSQENTCVGLSLIKLQEWKTTALLIRDSMSILQKFQDTNFEDYLRTTASESKAEFVPSMQIVQSVAEAR